MKLRKALSLILTIVLTASLTAALVNIPGITSDGQAVYAAAVDGDDWLHTSGGRIVDAQGREVRLTGINWFGYNTGTNIFDGVWNCNLKDTLKSIADHGFNVLRVPMSAELLLQWKNGEYPRANYNNA